MAKQRNPKTRSKGKILKAAEQVFAQKGFTDTTIADIAREAKVADATIYEYFQNKEDILFSIPLETAKIAISGMETWLKYFHNPLEKLRAIIYAYMDFIQNNPNYAAISFLILKQNRKFIKTEGYKKVREWAQLITQIINEAIKGGYINKDIDPYALRTVILGAVEESAIRWLLLGQKEDLLKKAEHISNIIFNGACNKVNVNENEIHLTIEPKQTSKEKDHNGL